MPKLKQHIYIANKQWNAHASARENLTTDSLITIEDYQRNIEVEYIEQPTSMAYSSNKLTVVVYPIYLIGPFSAGPFLTPAPLTPALIPPVLKMRLTPIRAGVKRATNFWKANLKKCTLKS